MYQSAFHFAKNNPVITSSQLEDMEFFEVQGITYKFENGDLNEYDRTFILAARTVTEAVVWAEYNYLSCCSESTYDAMIEYRKANVVTEKNTDLPCSLHGSLDVGDYQYRKISCMRKITRSQAKSITEKLLANDDAYLETNIAYNHL